MMVFPSNRNLAAIRRRHVEEVVRASFENQRREMVQWLIGHKGFSPKGADAAVNNYIETMVFVECCAAETENTP